MISHMKLKSKKIVHSRLIKEDIDLAMTKGVNYPKGLLSWADEIGIENILTQLQDLQAEYGEDRYRPSPILKKMVKENRKFY